MTAARDDRTTPRGSRSRPCLEEAVRICRARGWAVAYVDGEGFRPCAPDEPGAYVDLDLCFHRLAHETAAPAPTSAQS
jgi:hypothetical protein